MRRVRFLLWLLLALAPIAPASVPSVATSRDALWMSVQLAGRKVGSFQQEREVAGDVVTTTRTLSIELTRAGRPLRLHSRNRTVESRQGEPLAFSARTTMSAIETTVTTRRIGVRRFRVGRNIGGAAQDEVVRLPADALLFEGERKAMAAAPRTPGSRYRLHLFDPASQQVREVEADVVGDERVVLPEGRMRLSHQRLHQRLPGGDQVSDIWLDAQGRIRKSELDLLGHRLVLLACQQACAQAPAEDVDLFRSAMLRSPHPLDTASRTAVLRYRIHLDAGAAPPPGTGEQRVTPLGHDSVLVVVGRPSQHGQSRPKRADLSPSPWLQSDAPAVRRLAARAVGPATAPRERMSRLQQFVHGYLTGPGVDIGYASALEVLHNRQGDCTEYAVLLAAMARAEGIPARVASGIVYAARYAGASAVFVPHAWVQAWVDGRWQSYDAALGSFDTSHIALAIGDGDPMRYLGIVRSLGRLRIDDIRSGARPVR